MKSQPDIYTPSFVDLDGHGWGLLPGESSVGAVAVHRGRAERRAAGQSRRDDRCVFLFSGEEFHQ